ncbi:uncharacterized protein FOMMEDRAFT_171418 [Fomitiporia mediterranea MF3/22]|uniref:uncharacterized protein n=1 Tax=Fomitiporia mediterranea (strain MF3/22) TaxID=694068 RepID=UPI0004407A7E|nr:uncharacterized protein FOMMEDRAFT_171418 [Fomitiporia mediterranea MF3/22]EJC98055.1 hypothetical protein FOMMEDRAFT_171418 [Fomitiporia mediterranea MF3/22]
MSGIVHASTSLLRSSFQFSRLIDTFRDLCKDRLLLFALSHDTPDLEHSVKQLSSCTQETLGCLSGPLPAKRDNPFFSCSIAVVDKNAGTPFGTLITGGGPTRVGRWHTYATERREHNGDLNPWNSRTEINWNEIWSPKSTTQFLPQELRNVRDVRTLVYFSDDSSWDFATAIHNHLPQSHQLGIMASPTPFVTGQPFTLFRNGKMQSTGAVGIALQTGLVKNVLTFDGLVRLTQPLPIKRAEGNLIHELGDSLPARILLKAIQDVGLPNDLAKNVDYYIGIRDAGMVDDISPRLGRIIAGSPSRGSIAVEDVPAPPVGTSIEFYYRPKTSPVQLSENVLQHNTNGSDALFGAIVDNAESAQINNQGQTLPGELKDLPFETYNSSFITSSECGLVLNTDGLRRATMPWKCTVPSAFSGLVIPMR